MIANNFTTVAKEMVPGLHFYKSEVLGNNRAAIKMRNHLLQKAIILGNAHHHKVTILFETEDRLNRVETTVWHATETEVVLKGGVTIPVHCIREVII